ncbi:hypothetical protein TGAM01_v207195 [Trichoderma gamsii]|uniref:DUF7068 domain-containing protein n=1 Tax=Trichoderma gamsii TaxID=398673 RepID=A0A2P4ZHV4_9HYPO|nr:hypothetical protein TGAM01_v207195 [Trichoderma gamsii]PON23867.1 hypothetical protein TGAM01_v207195 [Trichoderma gamsii]
MAYNRGVSLTQVHPSPGADADTDIDIIAIHGLDTKSPDTWISRSDYPNEDVNWLACPRMLPERIGPARIFTCDWPADLLEQPDLIQKTAEEFARLLLAGIKRRPLPTKTGYAKGKDRPIVFIASCLGGITLIRALVIAGHSSEYAVVRQSTRGIVFLATPFRGTSFQDVADWAEPGLRAWTSIRGQKLVDSSSATLDIVTDPLPLNRRHVMMNKFNDPEDPDYQCVVGKIEEILQDIRTNSPLDDADAWIRNKHYAVDRLKIERLSGDLLPMDQCYINLAVVEQRGQDSNQPMTEDAKSSPFSISNRNEIETPVQPNIIVTSRPSGRLPLKLDLELETVGFYPNQVDNYIEKTFLNPRTTEIDEKIVDKIKSFLEDHWLIQGLIRIPIQLDALCYSWNDIRSDMPETMTALYQAIELSLWKKDIVRLEKKHNDRLVTPYHIQDASQQKIEGFVKNEISFLEGLAFAGLLGDTIEFEPRLLNLTSDRFPGLLLDKAVSSLSFLRTSSPSLEYRNRSYHFIHLTFQEYFAARYFVRQWTAREHLSYMELGSRKINQIEPTKFFQKHKYTAHYDILWRFVAGLLDAEPEQLSLFFQNMEDEPIDLLGPAHQQLVIHCLSEVTSNIPIRTDLEQRLSKWLLFEGEFTRDVGSYLACDIGFPVQTLDIAFREGSDNAKKRILSLISNTAPASIIKQAISWLRHIDDSTREAAIKALRGLVLSNEILEDVAARLEDKEDFVRQATIDVLRGQSVLPKEVVEAIAARLEDENYEVRKMAVVALSHKSVLPGEILKAVAARLGDEHQKVRKATVRALGQRSTLPDEILKAIATRLEDEDPGVRKATVRALGQQSTLPDEIFMAIVARLKDKRPFIRKAAVRALGQRSTLPDEILKAIAARLKDEDPGVQEAIVRALGQRLTLPDELLKAIAAQLEGEYWSVQKAAVEVLCQQFVLPDEILELIAARLEDEDRSARTAVEDGLKDIKLEQLSLPYKRLEDIATRLKTKHQSIRQCALRSLNQHVSLSDEALKAIAAQLKDNDDSDIQIAAMMALDTQSNLPDEIVQAIVTQLKSNEDTFVQIAAIQALSSQSNLFDKIIQAIATQFKDNEDLSVQLAAIEALGSQLYLSSEILQVIAANLEDTKYSPMEMHFFGRNLKVASIKALGKQPDLSTQILHVLTAQLKDNEPQTQSAAIKVLGKQSSLPEEIHNAIATLLKKSNSSTKMAAIEGLRTWSGLSNKILNAIASQLQSYDECHDDPHFDPFNDPWDESYEEWYNHDKRWVQRDALEVLGDQPSLPKEILNAIAIQLDNDEFSGLPEVAERALRKHREFYLTLLEGPYAPSLYKTLLRQSFKEDLIWCVDDDGNSVISMPEDGGRIVIGKQDDMKAMMKRLRPANYPAQ